MVETFKLSTAAAAQKAAGTSLKLVGGENAPPAGAARATAAEQAPEDVIPLDEDDKEALGTF